MADQAITALPVKTASGIANTDYLLGIDSAEGYQMLIKDLGDYIIQNVQSSLMGSNQTIAAALTALNSKTTKLEFQYYGMQANVDYNVANESPHVVFVVFFGTWNHSVVYFVYPNNGNTPVKRFVNGYGGTDMNEITFSAYGSWGITIRNTNAGLNGVGCSIFKVVK